MQVSVDCYLGGEKSENYNEIHSDFPHAPLKYINQIKMQPLPALSAYFVMHLTNVNGKKIMQ